MNLISIPDFIKTKFSGKIRPNERSVKRWIKTGDFPFQSIKMGNDIYIDLDSPKNRLQNKTDNPLLERILNHGCSTT